MKQLQINLALYLPFVISFILSIFFLLRNRKATKEKLISQKSAQNKYTLYVLLVSFFFGVLFSFWLISFFHLSGGHGYYLIEIPIFHMLFSGILVILGRIIIGWQHIKY